MSLELPESKHNVHEQEDIDIKGHPPIKYIDGKYICPERGLIGPEFDIGPEEYHRNLFIEYERTFGRGLAKDLSHSYARHYVHGTDSEKNFNEKYGYNLESEYQEFAGKIRSYLIRGSKETCEDMIIQLKIYRQKHPNMYSDVTDPNVPKKKFQIID